MNRLLRVFGLAILCICGNNLRAQIELFLVDENDEALINVQCFINDTYLESTDLDGKIKINAIKKGDKFKAIYLGYEDLKYSFKGDESISLKLNMQQDNFLLDEVILIGRNNERLVDLAYQVDRIDPEEIRSSQSQTSADVLEKSGSVYVQKSQMGGGSPILRGFEANKILLVVDGVRLNNAIYRNGHLQNAITIDHNSLASAEVIFGPGSLGYGSDAIGGVVHFRTKSPRLNTDNEIGMKGDGAFSLRYGSASEEKRSHFEFNLGSKKFASYTSIGYVDFSDLKSGKKYDARYPDFGKRPDYVQTTNGVDQIIKNENEHLQIGTGFSQYDVLQKFKYQLNQHSYLLANVQYSKSTDIPRYDQLIERENNQLQFAEWYYGPQKRLLISPSFHYSGNKKLMDQLILITAYQKIKEERNSRNFGADQLNVQDENVDVFSFSLDLKKSFFENQYLNYGLEWQFNDVNSIAYNRASNGIDELAISRYPSGGSKLSTGGIYFHQQLKFPKIKTKWHHGIRLSHQASSFDYLPSDPFEWPDFYYDGFQNNNTSFTWMNAFAYELSKKINIRWSLSSAFRAPNIDDLAKVRIKSDEISIPNPTLEAEKTINSDFSILHHSDRLNFDLTCFYSKLRNAIIRAPGQLPDGSDVFISNGDSLLVTQNINAEKAEVYGISTSLTYKISDKFNLGSSITLTKGNAFDLQESKSPLSHIPPLYGKVYLDYNIQDFGIKAVMRFNGNKPIDEYGGSADNPELATPEGALAWKSYSLYLNYKFGNNLEISTAVENLLDLHYRNFASGVSAPGRNFIISARYSFN